MTLERVWLYTNFDCNLQCTYCLSSSHPKALRRELTFGDYRSLVDEAQALGIPELCLTGGEPFLLQDMEQRLDYALQRGLRVTVLTNGLLLSGSRLTAMAHLNKAPLTLQVSLDGDRVGGERQAAEALVTGVADAACMHEGNYRAFIGEGLFPPMSTEVVAYVGPYDHCNMTAGPSIAPEQADAFAARLLAMSYDDPELRPLFDLEGLTKWVAPRTHGYQPLSLAVAALGVSLAIEA